MANRLLKLYWENKWIVSLSLLCILSSTITVSARRTSCPNETMQARHDGSSRRSNTSEIEESYRLPRDVVPNHYNLILSPLLTNKTFEGEVNIHFKVVKPTKTIVLHAPEKLKIYQITVKENGTPLNVVKGEVKSDDRQFLPVNLDRKIAEGDYEITITFGGRLDSGIVGFYASSLKKGGTMVASKFQPTYARQAFPCFDEPDFKATFNISLVKPAGYTALSNMNELSSVHDDKTNMDTVTFATSVPMSTYLACFVICDFDYKETVINSNGIGKNFELRSFAQKGETHKIDFAQDIGKRATEFYINYYQVPFPLPKLDMIAIPDYVSGATEHWGLITYRETSFLVDEATASSSNKIGVANTIAHELAHMWFGNLVTMKWWDEIWLNEGFATYMQVKALDALEPSWTMLDQFLTKTLHPVLETDAQLSSHPVVQSVRSPDQITAIFDEISYNKGSSLLRMVEGCVGAEGFRRGVRDYLNQHEFRNTVTQDLLDALEPYFQENNPGLDLSYILDTWTRQMGYPVLDVKRCNKKPNTYIITQTRFLLDPEAKCADDSPFGYRWFVPITYRTDQGENEGLVWFPDKSDSVSITVSPDVKWLKINNNQVGYYRVNYSEEDWLKLADALKSESQELSISDRAHLLNDAFALADAGRAAPGAALALTGFLRAEPQLVPWRAAAGALAGLAGRLQGTGAERDLQKYVQHLIGPIYKKQSWEQTNSTVIEGLLRSTILALAARFSLPAAEQKAREMFLQYLNSHGTKDAVTIEPALRDLVYYNGMMQATAEEWEKLWKIYLDEKDAHEQSKLRAALAAPRDTDILKRYLELAWDETLVRSQDYLGVLTAVSARPAGAALVWADLRARWPRLVERFSLNSRYLGNVVPAVTDDFNTEEQLQEMESFFSKYPEAGAGEAARRRALETVRNNIKWRKRNEPVVADWLKNFVANEA